MTNELQTMKGATFNYKYNPAEIEFEDYAGLVERAELVRDHYNNLVFKNATLSEINLAHKELNSFIIGLEDGRKKIKREYQKPLNDFEKKVKMVVQKLNEPLQKIKDERDAILDAEEKLRQDALNDYLKRILKDSTVKLEDIEIDPRWTNKGNWTDKMNPRTKLKEEIDYRIEIIKEENKKALAERKVLETFLDNKGMEHEGWIRQLEFRESSEIIQDILALDSKEKEPASDAVKEPIEPERVKPEPMESEEKLTEIIKVTATREKLELMAQFMIDNEIEYQPYSGKEE